MSFINRRKKKEKGKSAEEAHVHLEKICICIQFTILCDIKEAEEAAAAVDCWKEHNKSYDSLHNILLSLFDMGSL